MASNSGPGLVCDVGNWVDGDRFHGREVEVQSLIRHLRDGANLVISAPRRVGKTSLMREVARRTEGEFLSIHVDLQGSSCAADLAVELAVASRAHRKLFARMLEGFRNVIGKLDELRGPELSLKLRDALGSNWQAQADRMLEAFANANKPVVIYLDELAILVNRMLKGSDHAISDARVSEVDLLMSWLRQATIRHARALRFVIASSIGLAPVLAQARLSATLNTFTTFDLPPWQRDTAYSALERLALHERMSWAEGAADAVLDRLGLFVPHHVQAFWRVLREDARRRGVFFVDVPDVERVYRTSLLGAQGHLEFAHYEERLLLILGPRRTVLAIEILSEAAIEGVVALASARKLAQDYEPSELRDVMAALEHDGYLRLDDEGYAFPSLVLRDWWSARHKLTHVPLRERGAA